MVEIILLDQLSNTNHPLLFGGDIIGLKDGQRRCWVCLETINRLLSASLEGQRHVMTADGQCTRRTCTVHLLRDVPSRRRFQPSNRKGDEYRSIRAVRSYHQFVFVDVANSSTSHRFENFGDDNARFEQKDMSFFAFFDDLFGIPDLKSILQQHVTQGFFG